MSNQNVLTAQCMKLSCILGGIVCKAELCQNMTNVVFSGNYGLQTLLLSLTQSCFDQFYFLHETEQILFAVAITTGRNLTTLVKIP